MCLFIHFGSLVKEPGFSLVITCISISHPGCCQVFTKTQHLSLSSHYSASCSICRVEFFYLHTLLNFIFLSFSQSSLWSHTFHPSFFHLLGNFSSSILFIYPYISLWPHVLHLLLYTFYIYICSYFTIPYNISFSFHLLLIPHSSPLSTLYSTGVIQYIFRNLW